MPVITPTDPVALSKPGRPSSCAPHLSLIKEKLGQELTAQRIYQDLVSEVGFSGSYQAVKRFVRRLKPQLVRRGHRVEVQPGEEAQVDFGSGAPVLEEKGRRRRPWIFRIVLSYSLKAYSEAVFVFTSSYWRMVCLMDCFMVPRKKHWLNSNSNGSSNPT